MTRRESGEGDAKPSARAWSLALGLGLLACTSSAAGPGAGASGGTGNRPATGSGGSGTQPGSGGTGNVTYPPGGPAPTAVPIRRLTNAEYTQAVNDLFTRQVKADGTIYAGFTLPTPSFIPDAKVFGFLNISSSQSASQVLLEQYEGAAQMVALGDKQSPQVWT